METEYLINLSDGILLERIQNGEDYGFAAEQERQRGFQKYYLQERILEIREVVEEMSSIYIEVLELWELGLTEAASAGVLKILPNTVKSRRNKIRKEVRERLGVSLPPKNRK